MDTRRANASRGFTLIELLMVIGIVGLLASLAVPGVFSALAYADQVACASNLRQLGMATQLYLKDSGGEFFRLREPAPAGGVRWYFGLEAAAGGAEGERDLDRSRGALAPYIGEGTVEVCPAAARDGPYKPKFKGPGWSYGINYYLSSHNASGNWYEIHRDDYAKTLVFADAAQINTFQAPASPTNPMIEDWYYVQPRARQVQFRHGGRANVLFADWHLESVEPDPSSFDPRLPAARIGWFDTERVLFRIRKQ